MGIWGHKTIENISICTTLSEVQSLLFPVDQLVISWFKAFDSKWWSVKPQIFWLLHSRCVLDVPCLIMSVFHPIFICVWVYPIILCICLKAIFNLRIKELLQSWCYNQLCFLKIPNFYFYENACCPKLWLYLTFQKIQIFCHSSVTLREYKIILKNKDLLSFVNFKSKDGAPIGVVLPFNRSELGFDISKVRGQMKFRK